MQAQITPFVENVSLFDIHQAFHYDPGPRGVLISIVDHNYPGRPTPKWKFAEEHYFVFDDIENTDHDVEINGITSDQAMHLVKILHSSYSAKRNIIVHCHAGLCRSGAVAEVAVSRLGFTDTNKLRIPNLRVKRMLNEAFDQLFT